MYDLHTHSRCSDGSESPEHVAELAKAAGIELLALTDHDCVRGVPAALSRAAQLGLRMLPGVEAEADYADTLHILGIGQDIDAPCFQKLLAEQTALREERNRLLEIKLRKWAWMFRIILSAANPRPAPTMLQRSPQQATPKTQPMPSAAY